MSSELEVFLWDSKVHGLPANVDEASDMSVALEQLPSAPTAAMLRFAERVAAAEQETGLHYTHHGSVSEYVKSNHMACLRLELSSDNPHDALRVIGTAAQEEGLAGFVEVLGLAFLPDGKILPAAQKRVWAEATKPQGQPKKSAGLTYEEFFNFVDSYTRDFFCANGFVYGMAPWLSYSSNQMVYQRINGTIKQTIRLRYITGELQVEGSVTFYSEEISSIVKMFNIHDNPLNYLVGFNKIYPDAPLYRNRAWQISSLEGSLFSMLNAILIWLNGINSVETLGKMMLQDCHGDLELRRKNSDFVATDIPDIAVACKVINDPRFEKLVEQFEKVKFWGGPALEAKRRTEWPRLLKYLREEYK